MSKFLVKEAFAFSWQKTKQHFVFLLLVSLSVLVVYGIFDIGDTGSGSFELFSSALSFVVGTFFCIGLVRIGLKIITDERGGVEDFLPTWRLFWHTFLASLLYWAITIGGLILFIFPGIYWGMKYSQMIILVVDRDLKPIEALNESARMTEGSKMKLFQLFLLGLGILVLGAMLLFVGLLVAFPVVLIAVLYAYRRLSGVSVPAVKNESLPQTQPLN
jgi:uncharacterized membrane protein